MNTSLDDLRMFISVAALVIAIISICFTRLNWLQSNRPIVTAYLDQHHPSSVFKLFVSNAGNRPAVKIRLNAPEAKILSLVENGIEPCILKAIKSCFTPESEIPLLRNGEELSTAFGAVTDQNGGWLRYGTEIEISLTYFDLEGRSYKSQQSLKIHSRNGFGGAIWSDPVIDKLHR